MTEKKSIDYRSLSNELDEIVARLQDDSTTIEDSLKLYERGIQISKELRDYLARAENSLKKISASSREK